MPARLSRRKLIFNSAALACVPLDKAKAWIHGSFFDYLLNIVTDFGAPTNGTTDAGAAWTNFTSFLAGLPAGKKVKLTVPNHTYNFNFPGPGTELVKGVLGGLTVVIDAPAGATFLAAPGSSGYFEGVRAPFQEVAVGVGSSRIQSVSSGATTVTLINASEHTLYTVGQWILISGIDLQGFGSPMNPAFFEYRKITGIDIGTGIITVESPLINTYLSTWPVYDGGSFHGGPATIYPFGITWDFNATFNNIIFDSAYQDYAKGRILNFNNCQWTFGAGIVPTQDQTITFNDCILTTGNVEVDKVVETLNYNRCSAPQMIFQSMSCATQCNITDCNFTNVNGTPQNMTISGGTIGSMNVGPLGYGQADTLTINNTHMTNAGMLLTGTIYQDLVGSGMTMSGGIITASKATFSAIQTAVVGRKCLFGGGPVSNENSYFTITALSESGGNTLITTDLAGGFPNIPTPISMRNCAPIWSGTGNTGFLADMGLNEAAAQNKPLYSYSKRIYTKDTITQNGVILFPQWGVLVEININVITPYTGVQAVLSAGFLGQILSPDHTTNLSGVYYPHINLKQAGMRQITPTSVAVQSGDTGFTIPGTIWLGGSQSMFMDFPFPDISGENAGPVVEIEIITDQT